MEHDQGIQDALQNAGGVLLSINAPLLDLIEQLLAIEVLEYQVDVVLRLEYLIELQDVGVSDFPKQIDLVMETQNRFDVVFEHFFVDCLKSKLSLGGGVVHLVDLGEVSLTDDVADLVLALQVVEYAEVLDEIEPLLENVRRIIVARARQDNCLVYEPNQDALLQV